VEQGVGLFFKVSKDISMWTAGGLIGTSWTQLQIMIPFIVGAILIAIIFSRQLTILSLDENVAIGLGQNIGLIKAILFAIVTILTGTAVALVGNIAFVGLMVPHIVRAITGTDYRYIIPMSAIIGAILMVCYCCRSSIRTPVLFSYYTERSTFLMMHLSAIRKQRVTIVVLCLLLIGTIIISISTGYANINYNRILPTLLGNGEFKESFILYSIRLPRLIITLLSGMALALSGAILQSITRNDLADPGIIGINSGA